MLYAIRAGMERSSVATLSRSCLWRPIKSHRRSSIPDATFAKGESTAFLYVYDERNRTTIFLLDIKRKRFANLRLAAKFLYLCARVRYSK